MCLCTIYEVRLVLIFLLFIEAMKVSIPCSDISLICLFVYPNPAEIQGKNHFVWLCSMLDGEILIT